MKEKIIFLSLFTLLILGVSTTMVYGANSYDLAYKKRFEISKILNPFDRYTQTILEYFDEDNPVFTNYKKILQ